MLWAGQAGKTLLMSGCSVGIVSHLFAAAYAAVPMVHAHATNHFAIPFSLVVLVLLNKYPILRS